MNDINTRTTEALLSNISLKGRLKKISLLLVFVIILGTSGFMMIEGWSFTDSLYMVVTTLSTVGYREVHPLSDRGVVFNIFFITFGVGAFLYIITTTAEYLIAGHISGLLGRRNMEKRINALKNHYIVCGFGRVGEQVAQELSKTKVPFVVIDNNPESIKHCASHGYLYVTGDASEDDVLKEAGILRAKGLVAAIDSDADNVYIILTAKSLRRDVFVVARANLEESEHKLMMAGADRVVSPYSIGGRRLASLLTRPRIVEFLDVVMHSEELEMLMEEIVIDKDSPIAGSTLGGANIKGVTGANVLAIKKKGDGGMVINPPADMMINEGDLLVALGTRAHLNLLIKLARCKP